MPTPMGMTMSLRGKSPKGQTFTIVQLEPKHGSAVGESPAYKWPVAGKPKRLWFLVTGLTDEIYPAIKVDMRKASEDTAPLLRRLLDCNAGTSLPDDADKLYARRLMSLE
ncbi:hypothetical protein PHISP_04744 [Aspergillus sp. HF37]|nr:hypothetical protein PHISP_04744 [Aspergillus sp. HF37]